MPEARAKSVIKVFLYNCLPELLHDCVLKQQASLKAMAAFILICLLGYKSFIMYENYYVQCILLLFLVIYSVGLSGSADFVLFDSLDGKRYLFANVKCDITVLCIS